MPKARIGGPAPPNGQDGMLADVEDVLLHLCSPSEWRAALSTGALTSPSLSEAGFVHLSTPDQVALPAQRLFAGRTDMLLLAVDAATLSEDGIEVRWEPGVPGDPESMRFPHAYGPVPARAVLAVLPYRPDGTGRFARPDVPTLDAAARAVGHQPSVLRRAATREIPVTGGTAVLTDPVPASWVHNQLLVDGVVDAATVHAEADRVLGGAGLAHRSALVAGHAPADGADLRGLGWQVDEVVVMAAPVRDLAAGPVGAAAEVPLDDLHPLLAAGWRARVPDLDDDTVAQLAGRYRLEDQVVDVRAIGVRVDGELVAGCVLKRDGGTAWLDGLETAPHARGHGHARELLRVAVGVAADAGCDLLALDAVADDWPRRWYARLGLREVGTTLHASRTPRPTGQG